MKFDANSTFVISLKNSPRRRTFIGHNPLLKYTFLDACEGREGIDESNQGAILRADIEGWTDGAIGCALSHYTLWKACVSLDRPILIFEDDAITCRQFYQKLEALTKNIPASFDVVQLNYNCNSILSFRSYPFHIVNSYVEPAVTTDHDVDDFKNNCMSDGALVNLQHSFGTAAYIISPKGAIFLIKNIFPLRNEYLPLPFFKDPLWCCTFDALMNIYYSKMNAYITAAPFVMTTHMHAGYTSSTV